MSGGWSPSVSPDFQFLIPKFTKEEPFSWTSINLTHEACLPQTGHAPDHIHAVLMSSCSTYRLWLGFLHALWRKEVIS